MIQDHNGFTHSQKLRTFRDTWLVYINHHQHRIAACKLYRLLTVNDHVILIVCMSLKQLYHRFYRSTDIIENNICFPVQCGCNSVNTYCSAEAVHICQSMTHDKYTFFAGNDLPKSLRFYACLYTGIFFYLLTLSAKISDIIRCLNYRLITTASKRQINCISCKFIILRIRKPVKANTYTDGHCHFISNIYRLDLIQKIKLIFP